MLTLHCKTCNDVLGDSFGVCGELRWTDSILCSRLTSHVIVNNKMEFILKGELAHCIHSSLKCSHCQSVVGTRIWSVPQPHLDELRSFFLLHKKSVNCYILNQSSMKNATDLSFNVLPLEESMKKLRKQMEALNESISNTTMRLRPTTT
ncbi:protein Mis18-beta [Lampris incognitus]|uniref:protein Mis18-beta n=1 Tax=Lampris incognitus TaxID=2546036 RepID=UPI0024B4BBB3|nr:protein Mis18-beta [Lampris incognitus]